MMKIVWTFVWATAVLLMVALIAGRKLQQSAQHGARGEAGAAHVSAPAHDLAPLYTVPTFSFVNQDSLPITNESLKGKVWIAQFIFTRCQGPCPMMMSKMRNLQDNLADENVRFISFSVDPNFDSPEVLKAKANALGADGQRWHFLTGEEKQIRETAYKMLANAVPAPDGQQHVILHSEKFMLIDDAGQCRGIYTSDDPKAVSTLITDVQTLVKQIGKHP